MWVRPRLWALRTEAESCLEHVSLNSSEKGRGGRLRQVAVTVVTVESSHAVLISCCDYRAQNFGRRSFLETRNYKSD